MGYRDHPEAILIDLVRLVQEHFAGDGEAFARRCDRIADDLDGDGDRLSEDAAFIIRSTAHDSPSQISPMTAREGCHVSVVTFPEATAFDGYDRDMTKEQALKVLEEAAELVEAVKRCATWRVAEHDTIFSTARGSVLDEAMDVYQTLANLLAGEFTDGEIAEAYDRCLERNRKRGRL